MSLEYYTIAGSAAAELEISRSRFITHLQRVDSVEQAREIIGRVRAAAPRARHHCTAFVLGAGAAVQRSNDDGEPAGTAGTPMLESLLAAELSDVVAVVTRYFGGVLLGAGGLTRAYRQAVNLAIGSAQRVRRGERTRVEVTLSYEIAPQLNQAARVRGYTVGDALYTANVRQTFLLSAAQLQDFSALALELSGGAAIISEGATEFVDLPECQ